MKKIIIVLLLLFLTGCSQTVGLPDFTGQTLAETVKWSKQNDIELEFVYEYNNKVEKSVVYYQDVEPGTKIESGMIVTIHYSKGYDPKTTLDIPNFYEMSKNEIEMWLEDAHVTNYRIDERFDSSLEGTLIEVQIVKKEERDYFIVGDKYVFTFSRGELELDTLDFSVHKWRGVNLGGWFVLEGWMTPDLFAGVNGSDETVFMQQKPNAEQVLKEHWETFITEDDFIWLKEAGIEYVRLPIPWWLYGVHAYEGKDYEVTYARSVEYIHQALDWADTHEIKVLLDLHTAPGGQNGFDNGGLTDIQTWGKMEEETHYVQMTIDVLEDITEEFSSHSSVWGIEVLNEPSWSVNMDTLQDFYNRAYAVIREVNPDIIVGFHDGFRSYQVNDWVKFFEDKENVFFDTHIYSVFSDDIRNYSLEEHMEFVTNVHLGDIQKYDGVVPVVVGEWSYALPGEAYGDVFGIDRELITKTYGYREFSVFDQAAGWFFWNYKIDRNSHFEWDFRRLYEAGYTPEFFQKK